MVVMNGGVGGDGEKKRGHEGREGGKCLVRSISHLPQNTPLHAHHPPSSLSLALIFDTWRFRSYLSHDPAGPFFSFDKVFFFFKGIRGGF